MRSEGAERRDFYPDWRCTVPVAYRSPQSAGLPPTFRGQNALLARASTHLQLEEEFDPVDTLPRAAHLAITRALSSTPVVTKASDMKTLVDAAANALTMAEKIRVNEIHPTPSPLSAWPLRFAVGVGRRHRLLIDGTRMRRERNPRLTNHRERGLK